MKLLHALIIEFWHWFRVNSEEITMRAWTPDCEWLRAELTPRVRALSPPNDRPSLNWEIGPGRSAEWHFALSPGVAENLPHTEHVISLAPLIDGWEFLSSKPPKPRDSWKHVRIAPADGSTIEFDAGRWQYVMRQSDRSTFEVLLIAEDLPTTDKAFIRRAAYLVLEGILGERAMIRHTLRADLVARSEKTASLPVSSVSVLGEHLERLVQDAS